MTFQTLKTSKQRYNEWMAVQYKIERIKRNARLSYRCKLAAIIATDTRPGKVWAGGQS